MRLTRIVNFRHQEIIFILMLVAIGVLKFPLQHYITLARFQHYGICILVWALGFFLQAGWSWSRVGFWARTVMLSTGVYLVAFGSVLYYNPWLDVRVSLQTSDQEELRQFYTLACVVGGVALSMVWWLWAQEDLKQRSVRTDVAPPVEEVEK